MSDEKTKHVYGKSPVGEVWNPTVTVVEGYGVELTFQFAKHSGDTFHYFLTSAVAAKIHTDLSKALGLEK